MKSSEEKEIFVKWYLKGESTTKLADEFNVSRRKTYCWVKDYEEKGLDGLISNIDKSSKHHKNMRLYLRKTKSREEEIIYNKKETIIGEKIYII